jgi:hypothetical protein
MTADSIFSHAAAASCMEPTEVNANALRWSLFLDGARRQPCSTIMRPID